MKRICRSWIIPFSPASLTWTRIVTPPPAVRVNTDDIPVRTNGWVADGVGVGDAVALGVALAVDVALGVAVGVPVGGT